MQNKEILDYIKKSFELKNQGYYKPAVEMLYKALCIESDNIEILSQLAHLYKLMDNLPRAIYYIEKVLEINENHLDSLFLLKDIYEIQNELRLAEKIVDKICELQPISKNLAEKIKILNQLKEFDKIKDLENSNIELNDEILFELASSYFSNNDFNKAEELLKNAYQKNNKNQNVLYLLGKIYYINKNFEDSKQIFSELEKISPSAQAYNYLGLLSLNNQNYTIAVSNFKKAYEMENNNAEYSYNLASAYFLQGWFDEALKYFTLAISYEPNNIDYHYALAYFYYQNKDYKKASFEINFINELDKNHELSKVLKALILAKEGDILTAKSNLENLVTSNPQDDFAASSLAKIYKELSLYDLAQPHIKNALEINPNSLDYLSELAEIYIEQNKYNEARELIEKILKLNDKYIYAYLLSAMISLMNDDYEQVFDIAQNIIDLDSNNPKGYYYNALALFEQGDINFAIESLKKSISLDLNNDILYLKMSEFYQELGDFKNAYQWAKEAVEINPQSYKNNWLCAKLASVLHDENNSIKYFSKAYLLAQYDKDLITDYANYLISIGKQKQANTILNNKKNNLKNKNLSLK